MTKKRCQWCGTDPVYIDYHDQEWGVAVRDEQLLFEFLILEGMQAGLSWITILKKRDHLRKVYAGFDPEKLVRFRASKIDKLLQDPGIIRNRLKVKSVIKNANAYLQLKERDVNFSDYLWQFTGNKTRVNRWQQLQRVPTTSPEAKAMARQLKQDGFNFVGETICYAFMQAVGMVNDHLLSCFRHKEVSP